MKNKITSALFVAGIILSCNNLCAQIQPANFHVPKSAALDLPGSYRSGSRSIANCVPDTVTYTLEKATTLQGLTINTVSSASKVGQWFPAPQNLTISGFTFYAWQSNQTTDSVILTCNLYIADVDSLPTGPPLATATIKVDSSFNNGSLATLQKDVVFSSPVTIFFPYVLTVETSSSISAAVVTSDWDSLDGAGEWLGMASIFGTWLHGYDINVGGVPFDADFAFFPYVGYNIDANFTSGNTCIPSGGTVNFTNTSNSPILGSRFYNQLAYRGVDSLIYTWNYDDNTPLAFVFQGPHTFPAGMDYEVALTANMFGWSNTCNATATDIINENAVSDFSYASSAVNANFTNLSIGADAWTWNFGDGDTSHSQNPSHTFPALGSYNVCLTASNGCITNTVCKNVSLCNTFSASGFTYTQSGLSLNFTSTTTGADTLWWDFDDGSPSFIPNPVHVFPAYGDYHVCFYAGNDCAIDTFCQDLILCPELINDFDASANGQNVNFSNTGSGADTYFWDFGDSSYSQSQNPFHFYSYFAQFDVCLVITNDCGTDTFCKAVNVTPTGISETLPDQSFTVYPNPAGKKVYVKLNPAFFISNQYAEFSVFDVLGNKVMGFPEIQQEGNELVMDFAGHPEGIYFFRTRTGESFFEAKIVLLNR